MELVKFFYEKVAEWSKALASGASIFGFAGSNPVLFILSFS